MRACVCVYMSRPKIVLLLRGGTTAYARGTKGRPTAATPTRRHRRSGPGSPRGPRGSERAARVLSGECWGDLMELVGRILSSERAARVTDLMELVGRRRREGTRGRCGRRGSRGHGPRYARSRHSRVMVSLRTAPTATATARARIAFA